MNLQRNLREPRNLVNPGSQSKKTEVWVYPRHREEKTKSTWKIHLDIAVQYVCNPQAFNKPEPLLEKIQSLEQNDLVSHKGDMGGGSYAPIFKNCYQGETSLYHNPVHTCASSAISNSNYLHTLQQLDSCSESSN